MKKIKRLAALVLAGVMMMLMLTACGGAMTPAEQFEKRFSDAIHAEYGSNLKDIKSDAKEALELVTADGTIKESSLPWVTIDKESKAALIVDVEMNNSTPIAMTITAIPLWRVRANVGDVDYITEAELRNATDAEIREAMNNLSETLKELGGDGLTITGVGVAVKQLSTGDYAVGWSFRYEKI